MEAVRQWMPYISKHFLSDNIPISKKFLAIEEIKYLVNLNILIDKLIRVCIRIWQKNPQLINKALDTKFNHLAFFSVLVADNIYNYTEKWSNFPNLHTTKFNYRQIPDSNIWNRAWEQISKIEPNLFVSFIDLYYENWIKRVLFQEYLFTDIFPYYEIQKSFLKQIYKLDRINNAEHYPLRHCYFDGYRNYSMTFQDARSLGIYSRWTSFFQKAIAKKYPDFFAQVVNHSLTVEEEIEYLLYLGLEQKITYADLSMYRPCTKKERRVSI